MGIMIRFLMVFPRFRYPTGDPPIGPATLVAFLREQLPFIEIRFFDATFQPSFSRFTRLLDEFRPDVTGIYCSTIMHDDVLHIASLAKERRSIVVVGGPHATMVPGSLLASPGIDAVVLGEGELPLVHLLRSFPSESSMLDHPAILTPENWKEKVLSWKPESHVDLDALPFPAYDLLDMKQYLDHWFQMDVVSPRLRGTNVPVSRGCPFSCSFCQPTLNRLFGTRIRYRSPGRVVDELLFLKKRYGITAFILSDDTPTFNKAWMLEFVTLLEARDVRLSWGCNTRVGLLTRDMMVAMRRVGFKRVMVGIESASQRILDEVYHKGIRLSEVPRFCQLARQLGLKTFAYFMLGAPTETRAEVRRTIDLAFTLPIDEATFSITTPLPGTDLERYLLASGFTLSTPFSRYDYYSSLVYEQGIPFRVLRWYQRVAFFKFYLHPRRWPLVLRMVSSTAGLRKMFLKLKRLTKA